MKDRTAQLRALVSPVSEPTDGAAPDQADRPPGAALTAPRVAIIDTNQFTRDEFIRALADTHPELMAIPFESISEDISSSADPDVILLHVRQGTSSQMALEHIEQLRSAFPGVPVMAVTAD